MLYFSLHFSTFRFSPSKVCRCGSQFCHFSGWVGEQALWEIVMLASLLLLDAHTLGIPSGYYTDTSGCSDSPTFWLPLPTSQVGVFLASEWSHLIFTSAEVIKCRGLSPHLLLRTGTERMCSRLTLSGKEVPSSVQRLERSTKCSLTSCWPNSLEGGGNIPVFLQLSEKQ